MARSARKTIAIDFDGVVHKYSKGWLDGKPYDVPIEGSFEAIKKLQARGYSVYIHTTRYPEDVIPWFKEHGFEDEVVAIPIEEIYWDSRVLGVGQRKLPAIAYIDDRGVRFTNWFDMLNYF